MEQQNSSQNAEPLAKIIQNTVLPLWRNGGMQRCLIAPRDLQNPARLKQWLETGANISAAPYKGPRIAKKGSREWKNHSIVSARWPEDHLYEKRTTVITLILNGRVNYRVGDKMLHCIPGQSIISMPGTPFSDGSVPHLPPNSKPKDRCDIFWLEYRGDYTGCWICHSEGQRHFEIPGECCNILTGSTRTILDEFVREATEQRRDYINICQSLMEVFLMTLHRDIKDGNYFQFNHQKSLTSTESIQNRLQNPIVTAQEYIRDRLHEPLQINDVARYLMVSRTEFTQSFKRQTGKTFKQYLTDLRMNEARRLLKSTSWSINMVSKAVGLQPARLRALFHQYEKMSPRQYRQKTRST